MSNVAYELGLDDGTPLDIPEDDAHIEVPEEPAREPVIEDAAPDVELDAADDEPGERKESGAQKRIRQEIEKRKQLEDQLNNQRQQVQQMEQRFQMMMERMNQAQRPTPPPEEKAPSFDDDPAAHLLWQQQQTQKQLQQQREYLEQQHAQAQQAQHLHAVQQHFEGIEAQFAQQNPDYYERINELRNQRMQMWQSMNLTPDQALQRVQQEAWSVVQDALARGANPAQAFYSIAPPLPPKADENVQPDDSPKAAKRTTSIGTRGNAPRRTTLSDLNAMSDAEFAEFTKGEKWRELMGG